MAWASIPTLLPLDTYFRVMGLHPLHANGIELPDTDLRWCGHPMMQYGWQASDAMSREDVAMAINQAEMLLSNYLGFKPGPAYESETRDCIDIMMQTRWGYVIGLGHERNDLLAPAHPITYSDDDGDGYEETALLMVPVDEGIPADEIRLTYSDDPTREIRPITTVRIGPDIAIAAKREQFVKPTHIEGLDVRAINGSDDDNFETTAAVWHSWMEPNTPERWSLHERRLGILCRLYDYCGCPWPVPPHRPAYTWYRAGLNPMPKEWERLIAILATSLLDRPLCGCADINQRAAWWHVDMAMQTSAPAGSTYSRVPDRDLSNPLGTTRGALYVWRAVRHLGLGQAAAVAL